MDREHIPWSELKDRELEFEIAQLERRYTQTKQHIDDLRAAGRPFAAFAWILHLVVAAEGSAKAELERRQISRAARVLDGEDFPFGLNSEMS